MPVGYIPNASLKKVNLKYPELHKFLQRQPLTEEEKNKLKETLPGIGPYLDGTKTL